VRADPMRSRGGSQEGALANSSVLHPPRRVECGGGKDRRRAGERPGSGALAVERPRPHRAEDGLQEQQQREFHRGHAARGAREAGVRDPDLHDAEEGDRAPVGGGPGGERQRPRQRDRAREHVPEERRLQREVARRGVGVGAPEPPDAEHRERPSQAARDREHVAEQWVGRGRRRGLGPEEEERESGSERPEEREVAPADPLAEEPRRQQQHVERRRGLEEDRVRRALSPDVTSVLGSQPQGRLG